MRTNFSIILSTIVMSFKLSFVTGFVSSSPGSQSLNNQLESRSLLAHEKAFGDEFKAAADKLCMPAAVVAAALLLGTNPVFADEYGRETEAPTLFTGETLLICTKRGPLGACLKTEMRTEENDNDKADKYFTQPTSLVKQKDNEARTAESIEGNALIQRLKQQTEDNREKNELLVQQKTFLNDASASFGPFDSQVLILNEDGKGFTLLANPQAMRLKKAGFIKGKQFVKQPTQEQIDDALVGEEGQGLFGGVFGN